MKEISLDATVNSVQMNLTDLSNGLYTYQFMVNDVKKQSGKLNILK